MQLPHHTPRWLVGLLAGVIAAVLTTGVAAAYWSSPVSGSGQAEAGTAAAVTVEAGSAIGRLYPGVAADVATLVTNPNSYPVLISGLTAGTITSGNSACDTNGHQVTFIVPGSYPAVTYRVPARAGFDGKPKFAIDIVGGASMGVTSDNACQGKTFTIPLAGSATATA